jgi:hypothetical protein
MKETLALGLALTLTLPLVLLDVRPSLGAATYEDQVIEILNQERWTNGNLPPLKRNALLDASSETHSNNMASRDFFQHCDPDNNTLPWDRMTAAGYTGWNSAGENIAAGYATPQAAMTGWMNSSGHRANILSTGYREVGIGYVIAASDGNNIRQDANGDCTPDSFNGGPYYRYWTQNFGRISTVYPVVINREACQTANAAVSLYVYGAGWAEDMRFRNENGTWSAWQPYAPDATWTLSAGNGTKTVNAEIRNGATVRSASDVIELWTPSDAGPGPGGATVLALRPGRPNPFRSSTRLVYELPASGHVRITVHDPAGRVIATLLDADEPEGVNDVVWNGRSSSGTDVPAGIYFGRLEVAGAVRTTKLLRVR